MRVTGLLLAAAAPAATAAVVVQYDANPGPAPNPGTVDANVLDGGNQPWTGSNHGSPVDDGGTPAWQTIDDGFSPTWEYVVPAAHAAEGAAAGWKLSWKVKAVLDSVAYPASQAISAMYLMNDQTAIWRLNVGVEADGDQAVQVSIYDAGVHTTFDYVADGEGEVYHLYEIVYDPGTSTADLLVDGTERISDMPGPPISGWVGVRWGDGSSSTNPERIGNHNLVQWSIVEPVCADVDGDNVTGFGDLLQLLGAWGPCAGCPEDLNGDGVVGFADLLVMLGAWGPC